jgi:hypothetical protein
MLQLRCSWCRCAEEKLAIQASGSKSSAANSQTADEAGFCNWCKRSLFHKFKQIHDWFKILSECRSRDCIKEKQYFETPKD